MLLQKIDPVVVVCFRMHDVASDFLTQHLFVIKRAMLIVAHMSLFGFLFPELRKEFGQVAASLLMIILFLSPLSRLFRMRLLVQLMGIRRELGILMAYLATVHGLGFLLDPDWFAIFIAPYWQTDVWAIEPQFLFGILAYTLTLPLLFTSNNLAVRFLGGARWKLLHRLVYGLFAVTMFHRFFTKSVSGDALVALIQGMVLVSAYVLAKLLAWKNFIAPLRNSIMLVGARYQTYLLEKNNQTSFHL